jgi:hypothetical protein
MATRIKILTLNPAQGKSCLTNLLETLEEVTKAIDEGEAMDMVFLDYVKAFDSVPHRRLVHQLGGYGIRGKANAWIADFLMGRKQQVVVKGSHSSWADVLSGVPQGSVLGPILFILYVNELPELVTSSVKMFADDTKLYRRVQGIQDANHLQQDLDILQDWSQQWLLCFNVFWQQQS